MEADEPAAEAAQVGVLGAPKGYLQTILTYNIPAEGEVDKAFLESNGIASCLLNANTARNELGAPFFVRLQVMEGDVERACRLIKEVNPQRFGSSARVDEIDRQIKRSLARFVGLALPIGIAAAAGTYFLSAGLAPNPIHVRRFWVTPNIQVDLSIIAGLAASIVASAWSGRRSR